MLYHHFASFKQSPLDFFKLVDSRLILMLLYDSLNLIISGVYQSHFGFWGHRSKKWSWEVWTMLHTKCASALSYWKTILRKKWRVLRDSICDQVVDTAGLSGKQHRL